MDDYYIVYRLITATQVTHIDPFVFTVLIHYLFFEVK